MSDRCDKSRDQNQVKERLQACMRRSDLMSGWSVGSCRECREKEASAFFEVFDREGRAYWLLTGPLRNWQQVSCLWTHLQWVSGIIAQSSHIFRFLGPMLPEICWQFHEDTYMGHWERRSDTPYFQALSPDNPPRFENLVQLTAFLRLLQTGPNPFEKARGASMLRATEERARRLADAMESRIPPRPVFRNWRSFYLQNARAISRSARYELALTLGPYVNECFAYTDRGALLVDFPFFLDQGVAHMDLCRILHGQKHLSVQDRQYLVDLYFNMDSPPHFFTLLAHHQMTASLLDLEASPGDSAQEQEQVNQLAALGRQYDLFRTPVPHWYR